MITNFTSMGYPLHICHLKISYFQATSFTRYVKEQFAPQQLQQNGIAFGVPLKDNGTQTRIVLWLTSILSAIPNRKMWTGPKLNSSNIHLHEIHKMFFGSSDVHSAIDIFMNSILKIGSCQIGGSWRSHTIHFTQQIINAAPAGMLTP